MIKFRICIAASLIAIGATLIPASLIYAAGKARPRLTAKQQRDATACENKWASDTSDCGHKLTPAQRDACYEKADDDLGACYKRFGVPIYSVPTRPTNVRRPETAPTGQKVESTPKPTPGDKAPTGQGLQQSNPTPTPTPSPKKKVTKQKQGM